VIPKQPLHTPPEQSLHHTYHFLTAHILPQFNWPDLDLAVDHWRQRHSGQVATRFTDALPATVYHSLGGQSCDIWPLNGAWLLHLLAARIFDDLQDKEGLARPWMRRGPAVALPLGIAVLEAASFCLAHLADESGVLGDSLRALSRTGVQAARAQAYEPQHDWSETALEAYFDHIIATTGDVFAAGAWLGGRLYDADATTLEALRAFGYNLGLKVAILDDCRDVQPEDGHGVSDLANGRFRLPVLYAINQVEHPSQPALMKALQSPLATKQSLEIVELLEEIGAMTWSIRVANVFGEKARAALADIPEPTRQSLATYV
jgi:geranylgeranyl pyrophosphate synthase